MPLPLVVWLATLPSRRYPSLAFVPPWFHPSYGASKGSTGCVGVGCVRVHGSTVRVFSLAYVPDGEDRAVPSLTGRRVRECVW